MKIIEFGHINNKQFQVTDGAGFLDLKDPRFFWIGGDPYFKETVGTLQQCSDAVVANSHYQAFCRAREALGGIKSTESVRL
tara:strand:- start:243 stop:485 length:243 start_codon:yes stop_codon:yes gene_type:complete